MVGTLGAPPSKVLTTDSTGRTVAAVVPLVIPPVHRIDYFLFGRAIENSAFDNEMLTLLLQVAHILLGSPHLFFEEQTASLHSYLFWCHGLLLT